MSIILQLKKEESTYYNVNSNCCVLNKLPIDTNVILDFLMNIARKYTCKRAINCMRQGLILFILFFSPLMLLGLFYRLIQCFFFKILYYKAEREKIELKRIFNSLELHALRTKPISKFQLAMECYTIIYIEYNNQNKQSKIKQKYELNIILFFIHDIMFYIAL